MVHFTLWPTAGATEWFEAQPPQREHTPHEAYLSADQSCKIKRGGQRQDPSLQWSAAGIDGALHMVAVLDGEERRGNHRSYARI